MPCQCTQRKFGRVTVGAGVVVLPGQNGAATRHTNVMMNIHHWHENPLTSAGSCGILVRTATDGCQWGYGLISVKDNYPPIPPSDRERPDGN